MKRFFVFLLALLTCAALLCVTASAEDVPANVNWKTVSSEADLRTLSLSTGTHYAKITQSFEVSTPNNIYVYGDLTLDLNGCTITLKPKTKEEFNGYAMFVVGDDTNKASFTLMDSSPAKSGKLTFAYLGETYMGTDLNGKPAEQTCRAGAVSLKEGSTFTMKSGTIDRFGGTYSISVISLGRPDTTFNMEGGVIQNCTTPNALGGIAVGITSSGNTFNMTGGEIRDCATEGSGVIYASNATVHIGGSAKITNNKSSNGGAFYVKNGTKLTIDSNAVIEGNESSKNGGAIYACLGSQEGDKPSAVEIGGSAKISGSTSTGNGGAIYVTGGSTLTVKESAKITGNATSGVPNGYGGAIYADTATITMTGGTIENNRAKNGNSGNELYLTGNATFTMSGGKILHTDNRQASQWTISLRSNAMLSISDGKIDLSAAPYAIELIDNAILTATGGTIIADGTTAAFKLAGNANAVVYPKKAAVYAGENSEKAEYEAFPNANTYKSKYVKLVPGWELTLNNNGHGQNLGKVIVPKNVGVKIPDLTDSTGQFVFTGWYYDKECTQAYATEPITADTTLYAGWVQSGAFGLSFSGLNTNEKGELYWTFDEVTYGTEEWEKTQIKSFTIRNTGAVELKVELQQSSSVVVNAMYFGYHETGYEKEATLSPGASKTVYVESGRPSWAAPGFRTDTRQITVTSKSDSKSESYNIIFHTSTLKAPGSLDTPVPDPSDFAYGLKLGEIELPEDWSWLDGNDVRPLVGTTEASARYTLSDNDKKYYDWTNVAGYSQQTQTVTRDIALKIERGGAPALLFSFAPPANLVYDGEAKKATVTARETAPDGYAAYTGTFTVLYDGSVTPPTDAGTYQVSISGSGDGNYNSFQSLRAESWTFTIAPASVTPPTAVTGLVYNGETQTGVVLPEGAPYTLTGNTAKNAGSYTATAKLTSKQNYVWSDGTTDDKTIEWSIAKAAPGEITVLIENFTRSRDVPTPALSANPGNAAVRFYYTTENRNSGGTLWTADAARRLPDGAYYIYAELDETDNYLAYTTAPTPFTIYSLSTGEHIRVTQPKNGRILAPSDALPGSTVTVIVKPDDGYILGALRVTDESGKRVSLTKEADGSYSFLMPRSTAYIDAEFVSSDPFVDVPASAWYAGAVRDAWANGLIDGVNATHFDPDGSLTVAQAIKLAAALHQRIGDGEVTLKNGRPWYRSYLEYAVEHGVIEEAYLDYSDAALNAPVLRDEFAHILYGAANPYTAINEIASEAIPDVRRGDRYADEIYAFYRAGVLNGSDRNGTFHPASLIRRCEAAAILIRAFDESARMTVTLQ